MIVFCTQAISTVSSRQVCRDVSFRCSIAWSDPEAGRVGVLVNNHLYVFSNYGAGASATVPTPTACFDFFPGSDGALLVCAPSFANDDVQEVVRLPASLTPQQPMFSIPGRETASQLRVHRDGRTVEVVLGNRVEIRSLIE